MRTIFTSESQGSPSVSTEFAQNAKRPADKRVKFPVTVRHRTGKAKIYPPAKGYPSYRMCFKANGKRQRQTFGTYSEAKAAGVKEAKELHNNSVGAGLTAGQAQDAQAAIQRLEDRFAGLPISQVTFIGTHINRSSSLRFKLRDLFRFFIRRFSIAARRPGQCQ